MDLFTVSVSLLACLAAFLLGTVWVGISLFMVGLVAFFFFTGSPTLAILSNIMWNSISGSTMLALPLFVLMGEILFRSKISENLFNGLSP